MPDFSPSIRAGVSTRALLSGALWSHPEEPEVSVEEEFARTLGVEVGSRLRFDLQGVPLELAGLALVDNHALLSVCPSTITCSYSKTPMRQPFFST